MAKGKSFIVVDTESKQVVESCRTNIEASTAARVLSKGKAVPFEVYRLVAGFMDGHEVKAE